MEKRVSIPTPLRETFRVGRLMAARAPVPAARRVGGGRIDADLKAARVQPVGKWLDPAWAQRSANTVSTLAANADATRTTS